MLDLTDTLVLAPGVRLEGGDVHDAVRSTRFPVNDTGAFVVARQGCPLAVSARDLALRHGITPARAADDVLRFAAALNGALLANVVPGGTRGARLAAWLSLAVRLAPAGTLPVAIARRRALVTTSPLWALVGAARALAHRSAVLTAIAAAAVAPTAPGPGAILVAAGVGLGLLLHEAGHAVALTGVAAALVTAGARTFVLHPPLPPGRRRLVAVAGPAAAALTGALAVTAALLLSSAELAVAGCPLAGHAVGITVATGDGRAACGL
jgi:hypothetical protein